MYKCIHFKIEELVFPSAIKDLCPAQDDHFLWQLFDDRLLMAADFIRDWHSAPVLCNVASLNMFRCGLREMTDEEFPKLDPHKFGRALDLHLTGIENKCFNSSDKIAAYDKVRSDLKAITEIEALCIYFEKNVSWLHIDTYNRISDF